MKHVLNFNSLSAGDARRFDSIVDDVKADYHDLVAQLRDAADNSIFWQVSNLLSRNNYISSLFYDLCCLAMVQQAEARHPLDLVIVKTQSQKKTLDRYFKARSRHTRVVSSATFRDSLKRVFKPVYDILRNFHWSLVYLGVKSAQRKRRIPRGIPITLVDTFFSAYIFKSGAFKERYYTGLTGFLTPEEQQRIFFVPNVITWRNLKRILRLSEQARENFLYPFDFLRVQDYLFALSAPVMIRRINLDNFRFRGINISYLLKSDFRYNIALRTSFRGILFYRFFRRLRQEGVTLRLVVDWFENHVVDKGFNKGKNEFFSTTPSIGYQGLIAAYKWNFHVQPTEAEARAGVLPQKMAVIGTGLTGVARQFYPGLDVIVAPGLRFSDLYKRDVKPADRFNSASPTLLVALPIWAEDSLDILKLLVQAAGVLEARHARVWIKPHPSLDYGAVLLGLGALPPCFSTVEGDFPALAASADLLVSTGSTVCMESIAYGIPVIVVGSRRHITKNIIPETIPKTIWELCHDRDELVAALARLCFDLDKPGRDALYKLATSVRADYFKPVTRKDVKALLGLGR